jgi:hypothetical protein
MDKLKKILKNQQPTYAFMLRKVKSEEPVLPTHSGGGTSTGVIQKKPILITLALC